MPRSVAASASSFEDGDSGNPFLSADNPDSADLADQCDRARDSLACQGEQPPDLEASPTCASAATERSRSEPREFGPRNKELPLGPDSKCSTDSVMPIWSSTSVTTAHGTEAWPSCSACLGVSRMAKTQRASLSLFAQDCLNRKSATCAQTLPQCLSYWGSQSRRMTRYGSAPQGGSTTRASSLSSKGCSSFWLRNLQDDLSCATHEPPVGALCTGFLSGHHIYMLALAGASGTESLPGLVPQWKSWTDALFQLCPGFWLKGLM